MKRLISVCALLILLLFLSACGTDDYNAGYMAHQKSLSDKYGRDWQETLDHADTLEATIADLQQQVEILEAENAALTEDTTRQVESKTEVSYIGNRNTHVYHEPSCPSVEQMKDKNKVYFNDRDEIPSSYTPCQRCDP